jgi:hypothetical protein
MCVSGCVCARGDVKPMTTSDSYFYCIRVYNMYMHIYVCVRDNNLVSLILTDLVCVYIHICIWLGGSHIMEQEADDN